MILLDTDHLTLLKYLESERCQHLREKLVASPDQNIGTTVINVEEQMRGWLAAIARERRTARQIPAYRELAGLFRFFNKFHVVTFDQSASEQFESLRAGKVRIGTMDLKIAAIVLANNALLLTANTSDFSLVPGLRIENWIDD